MVRVLGVDACPAGWVGVTVGPEGVRAYVEATIGELVRSAARGGDLDAVAIDIPIGLPDNGIRAADVRAAKAIGRLRSSVFMTPVRAALEAEDHPTAVRVSRERAAVGVSIQAYGLRHRIFEVEAWIRTTRAAVREVHPEVTFAHLAGEPLVERKNTWAGAERRRDLLASQGILLSGDLGLAGAAVKVDDVLDAGAAAWTAGRIATGTAHCLPEVPETHDDGWPAAIWV
jgi:predicted RNase H-like nuclease